MPLSPSAAELHWRINKEWSARANLEAICREIDDRLGNRHPGSNPIHITLRFCYSDEAKQAAAGAYTKLGWECTWEDDTFTFQRPAHQPQRKGFWRKKCA